MYSGANVYVTLEKYACTRVCCFNLDGYEEPMQTHKNIYLRLVLLNMLHYFHRMATIECFKRFFAQCNNI